MKRTFTMVLCILLVMACFVSCTANNAGESSTAAITEEPIIVPPVIVCIYPELTGEFWGVAGNGANAALEELKASGKISGDSYLVAPSIARDAAQQEVLIGEAIENKVDGIVLGPTKGDRIGTYVSENMSKLADGGIPIITINASIEQGLLTPEAFDCVISRVMSDIWAMGENCGKLAMEALEGEGEYLCVAGDPSNRGYGNLETIGTIDYLEKNATDIKRVSIADDGIFWATPQGGNDGMQFLIQEELLKNIDKNKDIAILVATEPYTIATCNALKESNIKRIGKTMVIGFDFSQEMYNLIKTGEVYGTAGQNPYAMGYESVYKMKGYLMDNKKLEEFEYIPFVVVKQDNLETDEVQAYLESMEIDL